MTDYAKKGHHDGLRQAETFLGVEYSVDQRNAYEWLGNVVKDGRKVLESHGVGAKEVEAWDTACRISFLLATIKQRNGGFL